MADLASVHENENQSNTAPDQDICGRTEDTASQPALVITEGDDSVFYSEEEEIPQQVLDSIWAPHSGEPAWPEKLNSAPQVHNSGAQAPSCHGIELMEASAELDNVAMLKEMESKMENKVNNASSTDTDVHGETADKSRIIHPEELSVPPVVLLRGSTPAGAAQMKERADSYTDESSDFLPDESRETGLPEGSGVSLEDMEQEHGLDMMCDSDNKPFNHLMHAKYGTVSYRRIRRGQTRKRIEMFESMMQL
ncbi:hypothetical protein KOW79_004870 [Hemibagrus wyckioides]|uniref:Ermin n=1 Tax=Hemibagrus wyckioides TaxID=337641 RepID=A0A9D3NYJ8_9TELE|nr:uncharacterized protein LOC131354826 [Hemibagrus wyckioides]KAG7330901.1 hypothetical protein KOW79_004870 [Hemibagrus wyckioides]